jgi:hypothetical protein
MEDFRLTITGPDAEMEELEQYCRKCGVLTEHGLVSSYAGVAISVYAVHAIGRQEVLAQCIADFANTKKSAFKVTYFISGKGHQTIKKCTFEAVAEILGKTRELHFEAEKKDAQGKRLG